MIKNTKYTFNFFFFCKIIMTKIDYSDSNVEQSILKMGRKGNLFYAKDDRLYLYYNNV